MLAAMITPLLLALSALSCTSEAQTAPQARANRVSGPLVVDSVSGQLLDRSGDFLGTVSITSLSRNEAGDSLFASGSFTGTVTQSGTTTEVSGTFTDIWVRISPQSTACNHVYFAFGAFDLPSLGTSVPFPRGKTTISDNTLSRAMCNLAWEVEGSKNPAKEDRYLATINASLGG